ncbi:major type 1 subunit fimbrin (pilin) [Acinetobacter calcoaceticus]|uniref:Major type 1 subunit fimbrin (Pilin) n=1 Tax=Acinetobacter calcoaceticus TaxID=471 RepID=A0A4V2R0L6_ACICA|nr:major type 1 subunit fimbrin (pilin) [Acinetobacter calcoaceticus]
MKMTVFSGALFLCMATNAFAASVSQQGVIKLNGYIYPSTCELDINGQGPKNATIQMGRFPTSMFNNVGDEVGGTGGNGLVKISLKNCPDTGELEVKFSGSTNQSDIRVLTLDNTVANDTAQGVGIHLYNAKDQSKPLALDGSEVLKRTVDNSQTFEESFLTKYVSTDKNVTPGEANGTINFSITYK